MSNPDYHFDDPLSQVLNAHSIRCVLLGLLNHLGQRERADTRLKSGDILIGNEHVTHCMAYYQPALQALVDAHHGSVSTAATHALSAMTVFGHLETSLVEHPADENRDTSTKQVAADLASRMVFATLLALYEVVTFPEN